MTSARGRRLAGACAGIAALALVAGCGSDGSSTPTSTPPTVSSDPSTSTPPTATPSETPSDSPSASDTPSATTPPPSTTSPSPTTPALAVCAQLDVAVTRVPGAAGVTYGLVSVTNRGTTRCSLPGVPFLRLLDSARSPVTEVATADGSGGGLALDPGGVASTLLADRSDACQANSRSAFVEVQATSAAATVVVALSLPPCSLSVKPFVAGTSPSP